MRSITQDEFLSAYDAYADTVFRLCYAKTSSRDEASDLTQEVFTRVWQRMSAGTTEIENLRAFLFTVARNLIKDYYKKKKPVLERDLPEGAFDLVSVESDQEITADGRLALAALGRLSEPYREALMLHYVEGLPIGEIAEMLRERPNTVSVRVKRGIEKLRTSLSVQNP